MVSLFRNSSFNFFSQAVVFLTGFILSIVLARMLGPQQMGQYSFYMWIIGSGVMLFTLGLPRSLIKFVSQTKEEKTLTQIISRVFISAGKIALFVFGTLFFISLFFQPGDTIYLIVFASLFVSVLNFILNSGLQGLQKYKIILKINYFLAPVSLILTLVVLGLNRNLVNLLAVNLVILIISTAVSYYYLRKYLVFGSPPLPRKLYQNFKNYALVTSLIVFVDLILMERSEVFFLKNFSTLEQVAFYSIAFGLVAKVMALIPGAVAGVIMPRVSQYHGANNLNAIKQTYFSSSRYLVLITFPIIFLGLLLIGLPVKIFYGEDYLPVIPVIQILLVSGGLAAVAAAASSVLYGTGKQGFILKLGIIAASLNISLDLILIPVWGAMGAALANSTAQILGVIFGTYYLVRVKKMPFPFIESLKILIASFTAAILIYLLQLLLNNFSINPIFSILILIFLSALFLFFYVWFLYLLKFFTQKDRDILMKVIKKVPVVLGV